jgi:hypothetical protein
LACRPAGVGQAEPFQDLDGASSGFPGREVVQPSHHLDVLETGQVLVDGRRLSGQPETAAEDLCVPNHVKPYDLGPAAVRQQQGRKDPDRSGLACPIWPKQPEDGTRRNIKIDAAQCFYGSEALDEPSTTMAPAIRTPYGLAATTTAEIEGLQAKGR